MGTRWNASLPNMPVDYYPQKSMEELIGLLESLQNRQVKGAITEVSAAGVRTTRDVGRNATLNARTSTEILRVLYSLHVRAKGTDEAENWPNPYAGKITRTRPRYSGPAFG